MTTTTAPGKIILAGEYAVLDGSAAVVIAVDRRVRATVADAVAAPQPFLAAVASELASEYGPGSTPALAARRVVVDSSALYQGGIKLGLGSSAAVTVAAVAAATATTTIATSDIHRLAHRAHANAQAERGARGSGADIAAAVPGGVIAAPRGADARAALMVEHLELPTALHLVAVWTGRCADTAALLERARQAQVGDRRAYARACDAIAGAAAALIAALRAADPRACIDAIGRGGRAIAEFGTITSIPVESELHRRLSRAAESRAGALKPTGAGVGDIAIAAFSESAAAQSFRDYVSDQGITLVDLRVDPCGVTSDAD